MIFNDEWIKKQAENKDMIKPFNEDQVQPNSYDVMLNRVKDTLIMPREFMLAETLEYVRIPKNAVGIVKGKSSIGRLGLCVQNAGVLDSGFCGTVTLELFNQSDRPIDLNKFKEKGIAQILFYECQVPSETYNGHYQNQTGITKSYLENE